jgi:Coenzyme PQQ synthesis protein D (PqqD)
VGGLLFILHAHLNSRLLLIQFTLVPSGCSLTPCLDNLFPFGSSIAQQINGLFTFPILASKDWTAVDVKTNVQLIGALTDGGPLQNDALADESRPKRRSNLNYRTIDGETVILNRKDGRLHQLNPTGSFWDCCDGNSNITGIVDRLNGAYEVDSSMARKDVEEVLSNLRNSNLLERLEGTKEKF